MIEFFESCIPPTTTAQKKRMNRKTGQFFHSTAQEAAIATFDQILEKHKPSSPIAGPVSVTIECTWPWRKGDGPKVRALGRSPYVNRPDCDNLAKEIIDRATVWRYIENDSYVVELTVRKWRGDRPGIAFRVTEFEWMGGKQC